MSNTDIDLYAGLIEETQKEVQERDEDRGVPWSYLDEGVYDLRIYPEVYNGRLRLIRRVWIHRYKDLGTFLCEGDDCKMCEQHQRVLKAVPKRTKGTYSFASQEVGVIRVFIDSYSEESEYIKVGEPTHLILGRWAAIDGFQRWLSELKPSDLRELLDGENAHFLRFNWHSDSDGKQKLDISISPKRGPKPPIPDDWPGMDEIFITNDRKPDAVEMRKIAAMAAAFIQEKTQDLDVGDPGDTSHQEVPKQVNRAAAALGAVDERPSTSTAKQADDTPFEGSKPAASSEKSTDALSCPSTDPELKFGAHPKAPHPDCAACTIESSCIRQTAKNRKGT